MMAFGDLSIRGQLGRLRHLAEAALVAYGLRPERLVTLAHLENTTFRVEMSSGDRYVLRIHRASGSPVHPPRSAAEVRSETTWLSALREAGLAVPEPVLTAGGSPLTVAEAEGVPEPRVCVLFRWSEGRFLDAGLTPSHLERVGGFIARLHGHAVHFAPPEGFVRWRVADISGDAAAWAAGVVGEQCGPGAAATVEAVLGHARQAQRELGEGPEEFGLIHADLHQENYLFHRGQVRAIDFDDCGWGHFAYDLAVTLSELRWRPDYATLRAGLLRGYRIVRPLPTGHERYLEAFQGLRMLLLVLWFLEQRGHPAFPEWEREVRLGLADLEALVDRLASSP
jgi:Ser/Thr protein kinase RdoA (MazF antagonist)